MKKYLFLLFILSIIYAPVLPQQKVAGCYLKMIEPIQSNELSFQNDSISFRVEFNNFNYFCTVRIENKTKNTIYIDWDKFLMIMDKTSYPILFDDTRMILKNESKGKTLIAPETSIYRNIAPISYIDYDTKLYSKKYIKKHGSKEIAFNIPIDFNGKTIFYSCKVLAYLQ